jgi:Tol biopolymer transport system component
MKRALLLLSAMTGCTERIQITPDPLVGLVGLDIIPGDVTVTVTDLAPPHRTFQYSAMGRFDDGSIRDMTADVGWSLDNTRLGAVDGNGLFTASQTAAGYGIVTARVHGESTTSTLAVMIDATVVDTTFPPPRSDLFTPTPVTGDPAAPVIQYPTGGTRFPQGIASTLFQYSAPTTYDAYRLRFESPVLRLAVETGADRWQAEGDLQRLLSGTGLAAPITLAVDGTLSTGSGTVYGSAPISLSFSRDAQAGPLFFWSASTNGIMRGGLDTTSASKLYPETTTCVGCHAISRDNLAMAMGYDNTVSIDLQSINVASLQTQISAASSTPMGWATYSPDGSQLVVANNGILSIVDAITGSVIGKVPLPAMRFATHPDWSPDGSYLAVALTSQTPNNLDVKSASIARIPFNGGAWGMPEILVSGSASNNNYFPRWSPDGQFIAFVHATTSSQGAKSAELMLIPGSGGSPTYLAAASHLVGPATLGDLSNTMPHWSPRVGDFAWLAFVSARPYGEVIPTTGRGQIWITSVDLAAAGDSSSPAFWLPCQDVTVLNNNPVWAGEVLTQ